MFVLITGFQCRGSVRVRDGERDSECGHTTRVACTRRREEWQHLYVESNWKQRGELCGCWDKYRLLGHSSQHTHTHPTQVVLPRNPPTKTAPSVESQQSSREELQPYHSQLIALCTAATHATSIWSLCCAGCLWSCSSQIWPLSPAETAKTELHKTLPRPLVEKCLRSESAWVETWDLGQVDTRITAHWILYDWRRGGRLNWFLCLNYHLKAKSLMLTYPRHVSQCSY